MSLKGLKLEFECNTNVFVLELKFIYKTEYLFKDLKHNVISSQLEYIEMYRNVIEPKLAMHLIRVLHFHSVRPFSIFMN